MGSIQHILPITVPFVSDNVKIYDLKYLIGDATHIKVIIEAHAHVIIWDTDALDTVEIVVSSGAKVYWVSDCVHSSIAINCFKSSFIFFVQVIKTVSNVSCQRLNVSMKGPDAQSQIRIFPFFHQVQHLACITEQLHGSDSTASTLRIVGSIKDKAKFGHTGMITIKPCLHNIKVAQNTLVYVSGEHATVEAKPCFDIASKDIQCTHGAAIGGIDENQCRYLQARGINREVAGHILATSSCLASLEAKLPSIVIDRISSMIHKN